MLCKHQTRSDQTCPHGMSRMIQCTKGHTVECMNKCNPACPDFTEEARPKPAVRSRTTVASTASGHSPTAQPATKKCGGCGQVKVLAAENKFI